MIIYTAIPTGLYTYKNNVYYVTTTSPDNHIVGKHLCLGTAIEGYSSMVKVSSEILSILTPAVLSWFPNNFVASDTYPELFI